MSCGKVTFKKELVGEVYVDKGYLGKVLFAEIYTIWMTHFSPAGTGTVTFFRCTVLPFPSHSEHGNLMYIFVPWQYRHVDRMTNGPSCCARKRLKVTRSTKSD